MEPRRCTPQGTVIAECLTKGQVNLFNFKNCIKNFDIGYKGANVKQAMTSSPILNKS